MSLSSHLPRRWRPSDDRGEGMLSKTSALAIVALAATVLAPVATGNAGVLGEGIGTKICQVLSLALDRSCLDVQLSAALPPNAMKPAAGRRAAGCYLTSVTRPITLGMLLQPGTYEGLKKLANDYLDELLTKHAFYQRELADNQRAWERARQNPVLRAANDVWVRQEQDKIRQYETEITRARQIPLLQPSTLVVARHTVNVEWKTDGSKVTNVVSLDARPDVGNQSYLQDWTFDGPKTTPATQLPADINVVHSNLAVTAKLRQPLLGQFSNILEQIPWAGKALSALANANIPLRYRSVVTIRDSARFSDYAGAADGSVKRVNCT